MSLVKVNNKYTVEEVRIGLDRVEIKGGNKDTIITFRDRNPSTGVPLSLMKRIIDYVEASSSELPDKL